MNGLAIVDTDILIDAALQVPEAVDCLDRIERESALSVSVITEMELLVGCRNKGELGNTQRFLERFRVLTLDPQTCSSAVELLREYRLSHGLAIPDALIAATAMTLGCDLISRNQRDYRVLPGLDLLPYPE